MKTVLFNSDVGEEAGFDKEIMPYIAMCNIACGVHAGSDSVIRETIDLALQHNVKIGAHPSYPDRENFGRIVMNISNDDLVKTITDQIMVVKYWVEKAGGELYHVKPHGALYNQAMKNEAIASAIIDSITNIDRSLCLVSPRESIIYYLCKGVLGVLCEVFADRNYHKDLTLVSREEAGAVSTNPEKVFDHVFRMISDENILVKTGEEIPIFFDTICVHGDNPKSVEILKYVYKELSERKFTLK